MWRRLKHVAAHNNNGFTLRRFEQLSDIFRSSVDHVSSPVNTWTREHVCVRSIVFQPRPDVCVCLLLSLDFTVSSTFPPTDKSLWWMRWRCIGCTCLWSRVIGCISNRELCISTMKLNVLKENQRFAAASLSYWIQTFEHVQERPSGFSFIAFRSKF